MFVHDTWYKSKIFRKQVSNSKGNEGHTNLFIGGSLEMGFIGGFPGTFDRFAKRFFTTILTKFLDMLMQWCCQGQQCSRKTEKITGKFEF